MYSFLYCIPFEGGHERHQRYTVFFSVKEKGSAYAGKEQEELMRNMGLAALWREGR